MELILVHFALGAVAGAIIGSFTATILIRWPQGRSVLTGRSRCDGCSKVLTAARLVPLLSFLAQRGRCPHCKAPIDPRHFAIELGSALVGGLALLTHGPALGAIGTLFGCWLLLLALLDLEHQWLPDRLTLPLIPAGWLVALAGFGPPTVDSVIGALAGGAGLWLLASCYKLVRKRDGLGGGDPKLLAALGAWLGWQLLPFLLIGASLIGLLGLLILRVRGERVGASTRLPFGTMLAMAAWPLWLAGPAITLGRSL